MRSNNVCDQMENVMGRPVRELARHGKSMSNMTLVSALSEVLPIPVESNAVI